MFLSRKMIIFHNDGCASDLSVNSTDSTFGVDGRRIGETIGKHWKSAKNVAMVKKLLFLLAFVLFILLRYTDSDYLFGIWYLQTLLNIIRKPTHLTTNSPSAKPKQNTKKQKNKQTNKTKSKTKTKTNNKNNKLYTLC